MKQPVAYLRRSSANTANGAGRISYAVQEAAVLELASRHGDPAPELLTEWGRSGAAQAGAFGGTGRGGKRGAYALLKGRIAGGEVSALYAYSLSRLARSTRELLDLAEVSAAAGTRWRLAKEGDLDFSTPSGRLYLTVLAAVSTFEAEVSRERALDRVAHARDTGRYLGEPPMGWQVGPDGTLVLAEDRSRVEAVLAAFDEAGTYRGAALLLNERGVSPKRAAAWAGTVVRTIVTRERGTRTAPSRRGSRTHSSDPLARLLRCKACGGTLTREERDYVTRKGTAGHYHAWRCHHLGNGKPHPAPSSISARVLLPALEQEAARLRVPYDLALVAEAKEADLAALDARRARLVDALEAGTLTRTELEPRLAALEADRARLAAATASLELPEAVDWSWPPEQLAGVLAALWESVTVDLATGEIGATWRVPEWRAP